MPRQMSSPYKGIFKESLVSPCMFNYILCTLIKSQTGVRGGSFQYCFCELFTIFLKLFKGAIFWVGIYCLMLIVPKYIFSFI